MTIDSYVKCPICKEIRAVDFQRREISKPVTLSQEEEVALTLAGRVIRDYCQGCSTLIPQAHHSFSASCTGSHEP